jgi:hypothetical protein
MKSDRKLLLLFSHELTREQRDDAKKNHGVSDFMSLPEELKQKWSNVPPDLEDLNLYIAPFQQWLDQNAKINDFILIQGDFGTVFQMVNYSLKKDLIPIYSTTYRKSIDVLKDDGTVKTEKIFMHHSYRYYQ